jgi:hypothetical protein
MKRCDIRVSGLISHLIDYPEFNGVLPYGYKGMLICVYGGVCLCGSEFDVIFKN